MNEDTATPITPVMSVDDALKTVGQVCASFQGTLQQHQQIQEALRILVIEVKGPDAVAAPSNGQGPDG